MTAAADTVRVFPVAENPRLPSADRLSRRIRAELGEVASADVRLCVAPDGRVRRIELVRGSSLAAFDQAVMRDIADWQFLVFPGSSSTVHLRNCEIVTIEYRPHS